MTESQLRKGEYINIESIFVPAYGSLEKIRLNECKREIVVKKLNVGFLNKIDDVLQSPIVGEEIKILKKNLSNIVPCLGHFYDKSDSHLYISLDYFPESLENYIEEYRRRNDDKKMNFNSCLQIFHNIVTGVINLAKEERDMGDSLNPKNIFIKEGNAYLGYFGINNILAARESNEMNNYWVSPELIQKKPLQKDKSSIFSLALIFLFMLDDSCFKENKQNINRDEDFLIEKFLVKYKSEKSEAGALPLEFFYIIQSMLSFNPKRRPSLEDVLEIIRERKIEQEYINTALERKFEAPSRYENLENSRNYETKSLESEKETLNLPIREDKIKINAETVNITEYPLSNEPECDHSTPTTDIKKQTANDVLIESPATAYHQAHTKTEERDLLPKRAMGNPFSEVSSSCSQTKCLQSIFTRIEIKHRNKEFFDNIKNQPNNDPRLVSVSEPKPMAVGLIDYKYNQLIKKLINQISEETPVYRIIRGDGNCFYRSFGLLYLEKILILDDCEEVLFKLIEPLLENEDFLDVCKNNIESKNSPKIIQANFLEFLKLLYNFSVVYKKGSPDSVIEKLIYLMNKNDDFDKGVVLIIRALAHRAVEEVKRAEKTQEIIFLQECVKLMDKEITEIKLWGKEAEQIVISLLTNSLNVKVIVHYLEKNQNNSDEPKVLKSEHIPETKSFKLQIDLYFRPGHYDAAYDRVYAAEHYFDHLVKGFTLRDNYLESQNKKSFEEIPKIYYDNESTSKYLGLKCNKCKSQREKDDLISMINCPHGHVCMYCLVKSTNLATKEKIYCHENGCCRSITFAEFIKSFDKFKLKNICHRCNEETDNLLDASKCGHRFCFKCLGVITFGPNCLFNICKGIISKEKKEEFLKDCCLRK